MDKPTVSRYRLLTPSGKPIRWATAVRFKDGQEIRFIEKLPTTQAVQQARTMRAKGERTHHDSF
mgnify:CR=1 FL=1